MSGLFVQKHVEAVRAQGVDVRVIFSTEWRDMLSQWRTLRREWGLPDVVQLNVIQKQGLLALWLKRRYHIPYIIVEHWSCYLPENGMYMRQSATKQRFAQRVCENAETVLTVSSVLERAMKHCGLKAKKWARINNVVDDFFFAERPKPQAKAQKILLHISCFEERAKNTHALLHGFRTLCDRLHDVQLVMVGTGIDWQAARDLADELDFPPEAVLWTGEQTPEQVCSWLHRANAFVLTSRYETAGIVLSEAAATGTPILSTPVGIAAEIVNDQTGILVSQENVNRPKRLSEYMEHVLEMPKYPSQAQDFRAEAIGKELANIYDSCLHRDI